MAGKGSGVGGIGGGVGGGKGGGAGGALQAVAGVVLDEGSERYAKCMVPLREVHGSLREVHTHVPLAPAHRCGARSLLAARWATSDKKSRATPFTPNLHTPQTFDKGCGQRW